MCRLGFKAVAGLLVLAAVLHSPMALAASCSLIIRNPNPDSAYPDPEGGPSLSDPRFGPFLLVESAKPDLLIRHCQDQSTQNCPVIARLAGGDVAALEKALDRAETTLLASKLLLGLVGVKLIQTTAHARLTSGLLRVAATALVANLGAAALNRALRYVHRLDAETYAHAQATLRSSVYLPERCTSDYPYIEIPANRPIRDLAREIRDAVELGTSVRSNQVEAIRPIKELGERWSGLRYGGRSVIESNPGR
jgi:hypothetical protein